MTRPRLLPLQCSNCKRVVHVEEHDYAEALAAGVECLLCPFHDEDSHPLWLVWSGNRAVKPNGKAKPAEPAPPAPRAPPKSLPPQPPPIDPAKLTAHETRVLAVEAGVDERTARKWWKGGTVVSTSKACLERAVEKLNWPSPPK